MHSDDVISPTENMEVSKPQHSLGDLIEAYIKKSSQDVLEEISPLRNTAESRARVIGLLSEKLRNVWFDIKCDSENNTPEVLDSRSISIKLTAMAGDKKMSDVVDNSQ